MASTGPMWSLLDHLAGWLLLILGVCLLGAVVLMPVWIKAGDLTRQTNVLQVQAEHLSSQQSAYERFYEALLQRDPVLLRRLAYHHLGLKPAGATLLGGISRGVIQASSADQPPVSPDTFKPSGRDLSFDIWLNQPLPRDLTDRGGPIGNERRRGLVAATTYPPARLVLTACGLLCVAMGLLLPVSARR